MMKKLLISITVMLMLAACAGPSNTAAPEPTTAPNEDGAPSDGDEAPSERQDAQTVTFETEDGVSLAGTYYAPDIAGSSGVVLVHMLNRDQSDWVEVGFLEELRDVGYAVLTFDLRGHGESDGQRDRAAYPADVAAALAHIRSYEEVDPVHNAAIGASIGADSVAAACGEGCVTVISLSPGNFVTGFDYAEAVEELGTVRPVLCIAAENDGSTAETCEAAQEARPDNLKVQIYEGRAHGTNLFGQELDPDLTELILGWLGTYLPDAVSGPEA